MNLTQLILRKLPLATSSFPYSQVVVARQKSTKDPALTSGSSSSSSSSESDVDAKKRVSNAEAVTKLNALLQQIIKDEPARCSDLKLAKPMNKRAEGREESKKSESSAEEKVVSAVKGVAEHLGGDTKQTESELLMKLLNPVESNSLSDILKGMKIEREVKPLESSRAEQVRNVLQNIKTRHAPQQKPEGQRRVRRPAGPIVDQT